ncbi:MAG: nucleotide excision repair endonuclease [Oligoflexus sp.]|nr:nucleotide excision repair endonuclease [Oligoflexus sp.]
MNPQFDRLFGADFIANVPDASGVYIFRNAGGKAIYVGKAKSLKRRLTQYRLAPRRKAARKMRKIVQQATTLEYQVCPSEKDALLLENKLILEHKPTLNVAGAYSFLYPYLGIKADTERNHLVTICYSTSPEIMEAHGFELFGAFRSRDTVGEAYDALAFLLAFIGHLTQAERKQYGEVPYTRILCFRQMAPGWFPDLRSFFSGHSGRCLERLVTELLEKTDARQQAADIQLHLKNLKYFFAAEAVKLRKTLDQHGIQTSMIPQSDRDRLFLMLD